MTFDIKPTEAGGKRLQTYFDLKPTAGYVTLTNDTYLVCVHNQESRWIFSGKLVDVWEGAPVAYKWS